MAGNNCINVGVGALDDPKRKNRGITLIALIITVIVMLILAGVVISTLTGDGGLIARIRGAAGEYNKSVANEAEGLGDLYNMLNNVPNESKNGIKQVAGGERHTTMLMEDGKIMACGHSGYGQFDIGDIDNINIFTEVLIEM